MTRALIVLNGRVDRERACRWVGQAPLGTRVEFKAVKRSLSQNAKFWALLSDVATQMVWHEQRLTPDDWKIVFLDALTRESRLVPSINGDGMVALRRSSDLTKEEMSEVIEIILAFGAKHGIVFSGEEAPSLVPEEQRETVTA